MLTEQNKNETLMWLSLSNLKTYLAVLKKTKPFYATVVDLVTKKKRMEYKEINHKDLAFILLCSCFN